MRTWVRFGSGRCTPCLSRRQADAMGRGDEVDEALAQHFVNGHHGANTVAYQGAGSAIALYNAQAGVA